MAFSAEPLQPHERPNLRNMHATYAVMEDDKIVCYCLKNVDAEYVRACLEYASKNAADFAKQFSPTE